ncbi:MAG: hypothetical protein ACE5R4_15910 [Armatimonadota bacterium]
MVGATFTTSAFGTYATEADVRQLLLGYDLSSLGDDTVLSERIEQLLPATRAAVDRAAGRDFELHQGDSLTVDGSGHSWLFLFRYGRVPVVQVSSVVVNGETVDPNRYVVYDREGYLRLVEDRTSFFANPAGGSAPAFPKGVQNVTVSLDWGYDPAPDDIVLAQAKLVAAELLAQAGGGMSGGVESQKIGDYSVTYGAQGAYAGVVARWLDDVRRTISEYRRLGLAML